MANEINQISTFQDVDSTHPDYSYWASIWLKNQDCVDGQVAIKTSEQSRSYLPVLSGQKNDKSLYDTYQQYAVWFGATSRTVDGLTGLVFRKDPVMTIPDEIDYVIDDIDLRRQSIDDFAKKVLDQIIIKNRVGILIDFPIANVEGLSQKDYEESGLRPYAQIYNAENILNWRENKVNNKYQTTFVTLYECEYVQGENEFDNDKIDRVRVLDFDPLGHYRQRVFERREINTAGTSATGWELISTITPKMNGEPLREIPFIMATEDGTTWSMSNSVVNDLADVNISHYRNSASYENGLLLTGNPTPCFVGYSEGENSNSVSLGSSNALQFNEGGKAWFLSLGAEGLEELRIAQQQKEGQMALLGARIIAPEKRQTETAETASIHRQGEQSVLKRIANATSRSITKALQIIGEWERLSEKQIEETEYKLNVDFMPSEMDTKKLTALLSSLQSGGISRMTFFEQLKKGEIIKGDTTFEEYISEIEEDQIDTSAVFNDDEDDEIETEPIQDEQE
ncbi:MAG: DUF4055 domain-containing protein [Mycoplasma sp.]|nr:DUF4055 domain-containing protein [Mycoplasma sp.]